ncbi:MAG: tol-pal system protein YbgF, partial [Geminicoccaceae bacterium]|nr:tol-pal system protein YbgF [Geminicoccaceae bacterium]
PDAGGGAAPAPDVAPDRAAREGYVLGSIPRDAVLGLPGPDGGDAGAGEVPAAALTGSAKDRYEAALALLQEGDFATAGAAFERFLADFPNADDAASAAFWLGETRYFRKDYADAAAIYARNYRTYGPDALRAPDNLLKLGLSLAALGDKTRACQTYAEIGRRYPEPQETLARNLDRARRSAGCA